VQSFAEGRDRAFVQVSFRTVRPKWNDGRHIANVPSFPQHQHRHDAGIRAIAAIKLAANAPDRLQILVVDVLLALLENLNSLAADIPSLDRTFQVGMQVDCLAVQIGERGSCCLTRLA
jgi:hypothetical protein